MTTGLILGGCQVETRPLDVAHFSTNRAATKDVTDYSGTYVLYGDDNAAAVGPVLSSVHLTAGQTLGFEVGRDNVPYAVAGTQRIQLSSGRYRWEMTPDKGQVDWNRTNVMIVEVVVATVVVVVAVVSTLVATKAI